MSLGWQKSGNCYQGDMLCLDVRGVNQREKSQRYENMGTEN